MKLVLWMLLVLLSPDGTGGHGESYEQRNHGGPGLVPDHRFEPRRLELIHISENLQRDPRG